MTGAESFAAATAISALAAFREFRNHCVPRYAATATAIAPIAIPAAFCQLVSRYSRALVRKSLISSRFMSWRVMRVPAIGCVLAFRLSRRYGRGGRGGTRTPGQEFRKLLLCPPELHARHDAFISRAERPLQADRLCCRRPARR